MDSANWERLRTLFEEACDLPPGECTKFVERTRLEDAELGEELARLVATDRASTDDVVSGRAPWEWIARDLSLDGEELGGFRVLRELGRGGMGQVWIAEQKSPKRLVALKTLRGGLGSERTRRRFIFESELLARLHHPGIATVYEAGSFPDPVDGAPRPWFAMELVENARPIGRYVAEHALAPKPTIELFLQVCDAVQYGHQHGVIHRDLKPQNVLVDDVGCVKVIDFGVARALGDDDADGPNQSATLDGQLLGTPDYMSPEQLEAGAASADTRSDVWALGVMLYELLTGQRPYELGDEPLTRAAQALSERKFDKPSTIEREDGKSLARELDWILLRAIAREPERRYASAGELAAELRRYLRGQPILAGPPGPAYLLKMFAKRHRVALTAALIFALLLGGTLWFQARTVRLEKLETATTTLADARRKIREYADERDRTLARETRVLALKDMLQRRYLTPDEREELDREGLTLVAKRRERDALSYSVLELLSRAERLAPDLDGIEAARAELWVEKWREAKRFLDDASMHEERTVQLRRDLELARGFVEAYDKDGVYAEELEALGGIELKWAPSDAELHLFRLDEGTTIGGPARNVALPFRGDVDELPIGVDSLVLRVTRPLGELRANDVIFELAGFPIQGAVLAVAPNRAPSRIAKVGATQIRDTWQWREATKAATGDEQVELVDAAGATRLVAIDDLQREQYEVLSPSELAVRGAVEARVVVRGEVRQLRLPTGLSVRASALPLLAGAQSLVSASSPYVSRVRQGAWIALLRKVGYEDQRVVLYVKSGSDSGASLKLLPEGTSPPGFVAVAANDERFWILDREVRTDEYLEFLNDPLTRAEVDGAARPIRFPRYTHNENQGGYWTRGEDGRWQLPAHWRPDWPALGVSYEDAVAYIAWYQQREEAAGRTRFRYALPTMTDWNLACPSPSMYCFGNHFRPQWVKSCFSRPRPCPEPVLSFPIDESPLGVFDMSGSAFEWLDSWFWEERRLRTYAAGSWAMANPLLFAYVRSQGATESSSWDTYGFRISARLRD